MLLFYFLRNSVIRLFHVFIHLLIRYHTSLPTYLPLMAATAKITRIPIIDLGRSSKLLTIKHRRKVHIVLLHIFLHHTIWRINIIIIILIFLLVNLLNWRPLILMTLDDKLFFLFIHRRI